MAAIEVVVGGTETSFLVDAITTFNAGGLGGYLHGYAGGYGYSPLTGETSRTSYTTTLGTQCTEIRAYTSGSIDDYHKVLLIVPNTIDMGVSTPVVYVYHGVGNDEDIILPAGKVGGNGLTDSWLDEGWAVLSFNMGGTTWGNSFARSGFTDADIWYSAQFTNPGPLLYGVSMGACAALNYLLDVQLNTSPIVACALNSGATNFQQTYDTNSTLRPAMRTAYGLGAVTSSDSTYIAAVDTDSGGHDPQKQTAAEYPTIPFAFYYGTGDATITPSQNSALFITKLQNASWVPEINIVTTGGGHTADGLFQPADTLAFYQRALAAL